MNSKPILIDIDLHPLIKKEAVDENTSIKKLVSNILWKEIRKRKKETSEKKLKNKEVVP